MRTPPCEIRDVLQGEPPILVGGQSSSHAPQLRTSKSCAGMVVVDICILSVSHSLTQRSPAHEASIVGL
jgi:hypothetical protein